MAEEIAQIQEKLLAQVRILRMDGIRHAKKSENHQAETFYWQALKLHEQVLGLEDHRITESINQIVFFYGTQWRRSDAEPLIARSLELLRCKPGPKHRGILQTLDALASHASQLSHHEDAKFYYRIVLAAREELLGPNHPRTAIAQEKYQAASLLVPLP